MAVAKEHWKDARWFKDHRNISRYNLIRLEHAGSVRSRKGGNSRQSKREWCVEDLDDFLTNEKILETSPHG